jgi:hypothetical protein
VSERAEFSKATKLKAWQRCGGVCECGCGQKIVGVPEYDHHPIPAGIGGPAILENCRVMSKRCHRVWTDGDTLHGNSEIKKTTRIAEKRAGIRSSGRGFKGWRKMDGTPVWRRG